MKALVYRYEAAVVTAAADTFGFYFTGPLSGDHSRLAQVSHRSKENFYRLYATVKGLEEYKR